MSVLVLVEGKLHADKVDDFMSYIGDVIGDTRTYDGCEKMTVQVNQDDPTNFLFAERWATRAKYEAYLAWRTETGAIEKIAGMVDGDPSIRYFDETGL